VVEAPLDPRAALALIDRRRAPAQPVLTPREREGLELVGRGLGNRLIARRLGISAQTVKAHLGRVFADRRDRPGAGGPVVCEVAGWLAVWWSI
jgi:DNA-binding CsgD family transcriptional regulator